MWGENTNADAVRTVSISSQIPKMLENSKHNYKTACKTLTISHSYCSIDAFSLDLDV